MAEFTTVDAMITTLPDPDAIGESEYRAVYQTLDDGLRSVEGDFNDQQLQDLAAGILDNFEETVTMLRRDWLHLSEAKLSDTPPGEWQPDGWWRATSPSLWAESSDEQEVRGRMRPGDTLWRHERRTDQRWVVVDDIPLED